jgi:hypothetical protein
MKRFICSFFIAFLFSANAQVETLPNGESQTNLPPASTNLKDSFESAMTEANGGKEIAPTTQEEKEFLNAVSEAFSKRDSTAAFALMCWDNVPNAEQRRKDWRWTNGFPSFRYSENLCGIKYVALEKFKFMQPKTNAVWTYNVPVTKCIYIEYCPTNFGSHDFGFSGSYLGICETNGKLMIAVQIKKP